MAVAFFMPGRGARTNVSGVCSRCNAWRELRVWPRSCRFIFMTGSFRDGLFCRKIGSNEAPRAGCPTSADLYPAQERAPHGSTEVAPNIRAEAMTLEEVLLAEGEFRAKVHQSQ